MDPVTLVTVAGYTVIALILGGCLYAILLTFGVELRLPKRKPRAVVDPWATWKATKAELDRGRAKDHANWQEDFDRLVQAICEHSFPATGSSPTYYTCYKCKYQDPWDEPHEGCICRYETVTTFSSPFPVYEVTHRRAHCKWHGIDYPINQRTDRSNRPFKSWKA